MRLAIVTPGFSADENDWCIPILRDLVEQLAQDHEVTVVALRYPHSTQPYRAFGADILPLGGAEIRGLGRLRFLHQARARVREEMLERQVELIHAFWAHEPGALSVGVARRLGIPCLVSLFGGELADLPGIDYGGGRSVSNRLLVRHALKNASLVSVGSAFQERLALEVVSPERLARLELYADPRLFTHDGSEAELDGDPVLVSVGSLVPVKGHEILLSALGAVVEAMPSATLHLFGKGAAESDLRSLSSELGLDGHVVLHGEIPREELPAVFRRADLNLLGSHFDATPLVVEEALACGCPTVGTRVGVLEELEPAAATVPSADAAAMADAVLAALEPTRLSDMRSRCLELARVRTLGSSTAQLVSIYERLVGR